MKYISTVIAKIYHKVDITIILSFCLNAHADSPILMFKFILFSMLAYTFVLCYDVFSFAFLLTLNITCSIDKKQNAFPIFQISFT